MRRTTAICVVLVLASGAVLAEDGDLDSLINSLFTPEPPGKVETSSMAPVPPAPPVGSQVGFELELVDGELRF